MDPYYLESKKFSDYYDKLFVSFDGYLDATAYIDLFFWPVLLGLVIGITIWGVKKK